MKITTIYTDQSFVETDHDGCNSCNAAREVKRILSDPNVKSITIEVQ